MSRFVKNPVNEIVTTVPQFGTPGIRLVERGTGKIYEYDENGIAQADDDIGVGATASKIGLLGDQLAQIMYAYGDNFQTLITPYFQSGNDKFVVMVKIWVDRIVIFRTNTTEDDNDVIIVYPDGNTCRILIIDKVPTCCTIDAHKNLWVGTASDGIIKYLYDDTVGASESYRATDGYIPLDNISKVHAIGNKVWIVMNKTTNFAVSLFDGTQFIDKTTQFETDLSIIPGDYIAPECPSLTSDGDRMWMNIADTSVTELIYYNEINDTFYRQTTPLLYPVGDMVVLNGIVYCISHGDYKVWSIADQVVIFSNSLLGLAKVTRTNQYVYAYGPGNKIVRTSISQMTSQVMTPWKTAIELITDLPLVEMVSTETKVVFIFTDETDSIIITNEYQLVWNDVGAPAPEMLLLFL